MTAIRRVDPRTDPSWEELARGPHGSLFTSPPWIGAVCDTYGFRPEARLAVDARSRPRAGVAWVDVRDLRGERRLALPFSDRADPLVDDRPAWAAVAVDALHGDLPFTLRCLDSSPAAADPRLTCTGEAAWHVTPLGGGVERLFAAVAPPIRRNLATAARSGVDVVLRTDLAALAEYHRLHVDLRRRKYRLLAQPLEFLERIWKAFAPGDGILTTLAQVDGRPVAGAVHLVWGDTAYYKFGASLAEFLPLRPNDAVHWAAMGWAAERGLRALDWGLSDLDQPGLVAYKRRWAATEGRIRTLNAGGPALGRSDDVERTLRELTDLFTDPDVPADVTARAGATLYRYFC